MERTRSEHYEHKLTKKNRIIKKYITRVIRDGDPTQQSNFIRIYSILRCDISLFELWMEFYIKYCKKSYSVDSKARINIVQFIIAGIESGYVILNKRDINRVVTILVINKESQSTIDHLRKIKINMIKSDSYSNLVTGNLLKTTISELKLIQSDGVSTVDSNIASNSNHKLGTRHSDGKLETPDNMQLTPVTRRKIKYNNSSLPNITIKKSIDNDEIEVYNKYLKNLNILKVYDAKDIVHELTKKWYKWYNKITFSELVDSVIETDHIICHPHLSKLNEWFKKINFWIPHEILKTPIKRDQYKFIETIIKIAKIAKKSHNYLLFMAIYLGLQNHAIQRLHFLWEKDKIKKTMDKFTEFWDSKKNYNTYRNTVNNLGYGTMCIPYINLFKQDLIHLLEIPTVINNKINEDLILCSIKLCKSLRKFQTNGMLDSLSSSSADENPKKNNIIKYFSLIKPLTDDRNDKLFKLSRAIFKIDNNTSGRKRSVTGSIFDIRNYERPSIPMSFANIMDTVTQEFSPFNPSNNNSTETSNSAISVNNLSNINNINTYAESKDSIVLSNNSIPPPNNASSGDLDKTIEVSAEIASSSSSSSEEILNIGDMGPTNPNNGETLSRNLRLVRTASDFFKKINPINKYNNNNTINSKSSNRNLKRVKTVS
jgi:hypothetical protein